jgi:hypothetical protein
MKKINFFWYFLIILCLCTITSCEKEQPNFSIVMTNERILVFEDFDDLLETIIQVNQMTRAQLIEYEEQMNYTSYGRMVDDIYEAIVPQDTIILDSLYLYVENYGDYIYLEQLDEDESLEAKFSSNPQYYIMNETRMYIVGDSVYKLFEEGLLITSLDKLSEMTTISDGELYLFVDDEDYLFLSNNPSKKKGGKDLQYDLGRDLEVRKTVGSNQTRLRWVIYPSMNSATNYFVMAQVRPYKKTGIWFLCNRTIEAQFRGVVDRKIDGDWDRYKIMNHVSFIKPSRCWIIGTVTTSTSNEIHFSGFDSWGYTPSTGYVYLTTNSFLCYQ